MQELFEGAIRATFIALAIACVLRVARVGAPWAQHAAWSAVTVVMLFMPLAVVSVPKATIPIVVWIRQRSPDASRGACTRRKP